VKPDHADEVIRQWRVELPEIAGLPLEVAKRTARLAALFDSAARSHLIKMGLTRAEYEVLATLRRIGSPYQLKPSDLTSMLLLSSGGTSNVIHRLADLGYVTRVENTQDARSSWVRLTPTGVEVAGKAISGAVAAQSALLAPVPKQITHSIASLLRQMLLALGDEAAEVEIDRYSSSRTN
jgi:DNA-binding MarR family transcriptional regulator